MKVNYKDIGVRALKTFFQAFLAVVLVGLTDVHDMNKLKVLMIAGISAGISALMNLIKETA